MTINKIKKGLKSKTASGLLNVFIVSILGVMVFLGLNMFLSDNLAESGRDLSDDPIGLKIMESQAELNQTRLDMTDSSKQIQNRIENISESNVLLAGLYMAAGVLDVLKYMFNSIQYMTSGINALIDPILPGAPGVEWIIGGLLAVLTIYVIFKVLEAITGRTDI